MSAPAAWCATRAALEQPMAKKPADSESGASSDATSGSEITSSSGATSDSSAGSSDASGSGTEDMPSKSKTGKQGLVERKPSGKQSARPARLSAAVAAATAKPRG